MITFLFSFYILSVWTLVFIFLFFLFRFLSLFLSLVLPVFISGCWCHRNDQPRPAEKMVSSGHFLEKFKLFLISTLDTSLPLLH